MTYLNPSYLISQRIEVKGQEECSDYLRRLVLLFCYVFIASVLDSDLLSMPSAALQVISLSIVTCLGL